MVLKSDTPNREDIRRKAHMTLNSPVVNSISYDDPPATASQTKTLLHQSPLPPRVTLTTTMTTASWDTLTAQQSEYRLLQRLLTFAAGNSVVWNYADPVKIMQLQNCLTVAKRAHYNGEKETKLASFFKRNCRYMHIERTANGVTVRE